jgi:hypothetical protein
MPEHDELTEPAHRAPCESPHGLPGEVVELLAGLFELRIIHAENGEQARRSARSYRSSVASERQFSSARSMTIRLAQRMLPP